MYVYPAFHVFHVLLSLPLDVMYSLFPLIPPQSLCSSSDFPFFITLQNFSYLFSVSLLMLYNFEDYQRKSILFSSTIENLYIRWCVYVGVLVWIGWCFLS